MNESLLMKPADYIRNLTSQAPVMLRKKAKDASFAESGGKVDTSSITAEEVLEQANRIFAPYKLKFAAPLSWFAVWKSTVPFVMLFS